LAVAAQRPAPVQATGRTFYVSRTGSNADGLSWATAWNELSRINWAAVGPGDTIMIDGGAVACPSLGPGYSCGMVYNTTLTIADSGTSAEPITIRLASEPGRNGTAIIDGGVTQWSRCAEYASEPAPPSTPNGAGMRDTGITLGSSQRIVIDGTKWGGIEVRNHTRYGLNFGSSQHVIARYLKLHHNTDPADTTNGSVGATQGYLSQYNTLARSEIFRNGQDGVRGAGDYFTLEESYLHDHYCNHPDGLQAFVPTGSSDIPDNAGEIRGLVVRRNVFERIGLQSVFLGENGGGGHYSWAVNVTVTDNLFLNSRYVLKSKHGSSTNWTFSNNTVYQATDFAVEWCCASPGARAPMTISNNVFVSVRYGSSAFYLPTGGGSTSFTNNCLHQTGTRSGNVTESGTVQADPLFNSMLEADFGLQAGSACAGKGASITSVAQLLRVTSGESQPPAPTNPPPTATSVAPTATQVPPTATTAAPTVTRPPATSTSVPPTATRPPATSTSQLPTPTWPAPTATWPAPTGTTAPPTATSVPPTATTAAPTATTPPTAQTTHTAAPVPATLTFGPARDAYVDASERNRNFGNSTIVRTYASPEQRSYLVFDVQGLNGRQVTGAQLRIYANGSSPVGFEVQRVSDTGWAENRITYRNAPAASGVIGTTGQHNHATWVSVNLTDFINGDGTYALVLMSSSTKPVSYPSREADTNRPELIVTVQ
jgi:hypothetical protein